MPLMQRRQKGKHSREFLSFPSPLKMCVCVRRRVQLFATLWTVARQARKPEWTRKLKCSFSRESSQRRNRTEVFCTAGSFFTV